MATWQADFELMLPAVGLGGGFLETIGQILPPVPSWSSDVLLFGVQDGHCVHIVLERSAIIEVTLRVDLRDYQLEGLSPLLECFRAAGCELRSDQGHVVSAESAAVSAAVRASPAFEFVRDPRAYLERLCGTDTALKAGGHERKPIAVPELLRRGGRIERRQTTFWELADPLGAHSWRVHFIDKAEFRFEADQFDSAAVVSEHAVLLNHLEASEQLFVWSPAEDPDAVLLELERRATKHFGGWRDLQGYLNQDYPSRKILLKGAGMLLRAPRSFVDVCAATLEGEGIRVGELFRGSVPKATKLAMVLGQNFVVAESFVFESRRL